MADVGGSGPLAGRMQALLLPRDITLWEGAGSGASYTERNPRPSLAAPDQDTHLRLIPGGTPTGTDTYQWYVAHGGLPGEVDHGLTLLTKRGTDTLWMAWEPPSAISGFEVANWSPSGNQREPSIVSLSDGTLIKAVREAATTIRIYSKAPGATGWTNQGLAANGPWVFFPELVVVDDEVLLLAWRSSYTFLTSLSADTKFYIGVWRATQADLSTWTEVQDAATVEQDVRRSNRVYSAADVYSCGRIRAAYRDGQLLVLSGLHKHASAGQTDYIRQYASASLGARLDLVGTYQGASAGWALPDVVATPAGFVASWLSYQERPHVAVLGSAWQPISTADLGAISPTGSAGSVFDWKEGYGWTTPSGTAVTLEADGIGEMALAYHPSGVVWMYTMSVVGGAVASGIAVCYYSPDGGTTWRTGHASYPAATDISGYWCYPEDDGASSGTQGNYPTQVSATWVRGQVALEHAFSAATDTDGLAGTVTATTFLGAWTDLPLPREEDGIRVGDRCGWLRTVLPFERLSAQDYTRTNSGTSTHTVNTTGRHRFTTGDGAGTGGAEWYKFTGVSNGDDQRGRGMVMIEAQSVDTGAETNPNVSLRMRLADTNHGIEVGFNRSATALYIRDVNAGTTLGSVTGIAANADVWIRWGMQMQSDTGAGRAVQVWYRIEDGSTWHKQKWTRIGQYTLSDDSGAGGTAPHVEWGHLASSGGTTQTVSEWIGPFFTIPYSATGGESISGTDATWYDLDQSGGDNPTKCIGAPIGSAQVWSIDGVTVAGRRGPGWIGQTFSASVSGDYEVTRGFSLNTPSPRIRHETIDDNSDTVLPWAADPDRPGVEDSAHPPYMALHAFTNCRQLLLQSKTAAGAWTTRATIDTRVLSGASYTRLGTVLQANNPVSAVYLSEDEVTSDWTVEWDNGAGTQVRRNPQGNRQGRWSNSTSEPIARIELAGTEAGDPTGGGTLNLWSPRVTVIVPGQTCTAWRLVADSTYPTVSGRHHLKWYWCDVHLFAFPPSWQRGISFEPGHERVALEGDVGVNVDRSDVADVMRLAWDTGVDETALRDSSQAMRTVVADTGGGVPMVAEAAAVSSLLYALKRHRGYPVVWCTWERTSSGVVTLRRDHEHMLSTIEAPPDMESVLGYSALSELQRLGNLRIRSER